jgi:hypothetical protein
MSDAKIFTENWAAEMRWQLWGRLDLRYKAIRLREKMAMRIVWALPNWVIKWAVVRALAHATMGEWGMEHPGAVTAFQVMDRWPEK